MTLRPLLTIFILFTVILLACNTAVKDKIMTLDKSEKQNLQPTQKKLNVLWIVVEDLGTQIPSFGDSTVVTPNISRLAKEGICYDNFFTPAAVCAPARSAIATGMYPTKLGSNNMRTGPWYKSDVSGAELKRYTETQLPPGIPAHQAVPQAGVRMMSEYLREQGYYCTNNSKQDYQFKRTIAAWDECDNDGHWRNRKSDQPFFSIFNIGVTHESQVWARADKPLMVDKDLKVPVPPYLPDTEVGQTDIRRMYSNIIEMDNRVGEILAELEEDGLLDETVIFWYTDHGGPLPRQKRLLYDSGIHVPLIVRFPHMKDASSRNEDMLSFIDLAPTVLSIAGINPPTYMDGKAFLGSYESEQKSEYVYAAADRFDESYDHVRAVRDDRYKYIRYFEPDKPMFLPIAYREQMAIMGELHKLKDEGNLTEAQALWFRKTKPKEELFDTQSDPHEINSLIGQTAYDDVLEELRGAMDNWLASFEDRGLMDERKLMEVMLEGGQQPICRSVSISQLSDEIYMYNDDPAATIAYKSYPGDNSWQIYQGPFKSSGLDSIHAVADRIGYEHSAESLWMNARME